MLGCYRKPRLAARSFPAFGFSKRSGFTGNPLEGSAVVTVTDEPARTFQTVSQRQTHTSTAQVTVIHLTNSENGTRKNWSSDRRVGAKFGGNANQHLASDFFASVLVMHNSTKAVVRR
jgi:hypothetical protein